MPSWDEGVERGSTTTGSGFSWRPTVRSRTWEPGELGAEIRSTSTGNAKLIEWSSSKRCQPPEGWWDETEDPFAPDGRS